MKLTPDTFGINEAWVMFRVGGLLFVGGNPIDIYLLMDASSGYVFGHLPCEGDRPDKKALTALFKEAFNAKYEWPYALYLPKGEPAETLFREEAEKSSIDVHTVPLSHLEAIIEPVRESFIDLYRGQPSMLTPDEQKEVRQFIPDSYDPCSCASGKRFKDCCKPIYPMIVGAMCAFENGDFIRAVFWMNQAVEKVGETGEVLCRMAIVLSMESEKNYLKYLDKALKVSPNHPRAHYLYGLHYAEIGDLEAAKRSYQTAIAHYPSSDKYHLNEAWNNLGLIYYDLKDIKKAKEARSTDFICIIFEQVDDG